jgi:hypothetical protein
MSFLNRETGSVIGGAVSPLAGRRTGAVIQLEHLVVMAMLHDRFIRDQELYIQWETLHERDMHSMKKPLKRLIRLIKYI